MAVQPKKDLAAVSYNSSGWNKYIANFIYLILVTHSVAICGIQEHWLLNPNLYKLKENMTDYEVFAIPAVKSDNCPGRPSSGLAIFFHKQFLTS